MSSSVANYGIVTNNTISSTTPFNLELWCGHTGGVPQYHLSLGQDATVLKRNNIDKIDSATLTIDLPAYIGCNKVNFCNPVHFRSDFAPASSVARLTDISLDGIEKNSVVFASSEHGAAGNVLCSKYTYSLCWEFTDALDLSGSTGQDCDGHDNPVGFNGSHMALSFDGNNLARELTHATGFPLANGMSDQCSILSGRLTLCGRRDDRDTVCCD